MEKLKTFLSFPDYRIAQALWLQQQFENQIIYIPLSVFAIEHYTGYLELCGVQDDSIFQKLGEITSRVSQYLPDGLFNPEYIPEVAAEYNNLVADAISVNDGRMHEIMEKHFNKI